MMRLMFLLLTVTIFAGDSSPMIAADKVATFSALPAGDELRMTITSSGCFHYVKHEFTFRRSTTLTVSISETNYTSSRFFEEPIALDPVELGERAMAPEEEVSLDQILTLYRTGSDVWSTSVDKVTISQQRDGKAIATEKFESGYYPENLRTPHELVRLVREANEAK